MGVFDRSEAVGFIYGISNAVSDMLILLATKIQVLYLPSTVDAYVRYTYFYNKFC